MSLAATLLLWREKAIEKSIAKYSKCVKSTQERIEIVQRWIRANRKEIKKLKEKYVEMKLDDIHNKDK